MPPLFLQAKVVYPPGPWGDERPVVGATVEVIDIDLPGKGDDVIWAGRTDDEGRFSGHSSEWRDSAHVAVFVADGGEAPHWETIVVPDMSDILALTAHVSDGGQSTWLPFIYIDDDTPSPPLVVPWPPADAVHPATTEPSSAFPLVYVNGSSCASVADMSACFLAELRAEAREIRVDVIEPDAVQLMRTSGELARIAEWAGERFGLPSSRRVERAPSSIEDAASFSVGSAVMKAGAGRNPLLVAIGTSLLQSTSQGYQCISADLVRKTKSMPGFGLRFVAVR